jgi:hypothetical protein
MRSSAIHNELRASVSHEPRLRPGVALTSTPQLPEGSGHGRRREQSRRAPATEIGDDS